MVNYLYGFIFCIMGCTHGNDSCYTFINKYANERGSIDTAYYIKYASRVISNDKKCIDVLIIRGDLFFYSGEIDKANADYKTVYALSSTNVYSMYKIGMVNELKQKYDSADLYYSKALDLKRVDSTVFIDYLNDFGLKDGKAKYDVDIIELMYRKGVCSIHLENNPLASKIFDICISENYNLPDSYNYKGILLLKQKKYPEACSYFKKSIALGNDEAHYYLDKYCQ